MKNQSRILALMLLLLVALNLLVACGAKPEIISVTEAPPTEAAGEQTMPEQAPTDPISPPEGTATNTAVANLPSVTGAEPDPQSAFVQLTADEKSAFLTWLDELIKTYKSIAQSIGEFADKSEIMEQLKNPTNLAENEHYQKLKTDVNASLESLKQAQGSLNAASLASLKTLTEGVQTWFGSFFQQFEQEAQNNSAGVLAWMQAQMTELGQKLQELLQVLEDLKS